MIINTQFYTKYGPRVFYFLSLGLLLWNVFEIRKRTFSVFKTDRQPYGLENGTFSGEIFRFSFSGRPPLGNGAPFSINIVIETGAWIWSRHGFPHIVRGNKRSNVPKTAGQAAPDAAMPRSSR